MSQTTANQSNLTSRVIPCPICRKDVNWGEAPWRPFCSERCKTIDFGAWANEERSIPVSMQDEMFDEDF
ncbi:MAG: DNA gyrase inhibitor YacG [Gammaproteobacteria bacterium]|nr:DNA gyrase inhibitor YacG [Gammaproteobacteria bacterium]HBF09101.1 DNA gyrase inhibitor YacG [Gammaproteobacteria bacterium]